MSSERQKKKKTSSHISRKSMNARNAGTPEASVADADFENASEVAPLVKDLQKKGGEHIHTAVKKLQRSGIIDERGKRVRKGLPPDMQPDSKCQLPG